MAAVTRDIAVGSPADPTDPAVAAADADGVATGANERVSGTVTPKQAGSASSSDEGEITPSTSVKSNVIPPTEAELALLQQSLQVPQPSAKAALCNARISPEAPANFTPGSADSEFRAHAAHLQYLLQYQQQLLAQVEQNRMYTANPYGFQAVPGMVGHGLAAPMNMAGISSPHAGLMYGALPALISKQMNPQHMHMMPNMELAEKVVMQGSGNTGVRNPLAVPDYAHIQVCSSVHLCILGRVPSPPHSHFHTLYTR